VTLGRSAKAALAALWRETRVIAAALWTTLRGAGLWLWRNVYWRRVKAIGRIGWSALNRYWSHDGDALAGYVAYATFLSMFPFAIFATALFGAFITPEAMDRAVASLFDLAPPHIAQTLQPAVESIALDNPNPLITTSALFAMWFASNAVEAMRVSMERAYATTRPRHFAISRVRALAFVVLAALTFALLGALIVLAPAAMRYAELQLGHFVPYALDAVRYMLAIGVFGLFLYQAHLLLPARRPRRQRLMPGIAVSVALWALGGFGFALYLQWAPSLSVTYGTFAGVIVTLLFFYLTGAAIIYGTEVNAVLMRYRRDVREL